MIYSIPHNKIRNITMLMTLALVVASCGSYQQASYYDNDGIYASNTPETVERRPEQRVNNQRSAETDTYTDYFEEKANQYNDILDSEIFTDVDAYSTNENGEYVQQNQLTDYYANENDYQGYGGWGDNATSVSINIYDNGWNNWGYGGQFGWGNSLWGWNNYGYGGYYGYGWNNPWRWNRWNNWGYSGFGFGYAGYGYGWNSPYYNYGYGYGNRNYNRHYGYNNRNYAVSNSRRGNYIRPSTNSAISSALRGRSNVNTRGDSPRYRSTTSRTATTRSSTGTRSSRTYSGNSTTTRRSVGVDQNRAYRTSRSTRATPRYNSSSRSSNTTNRYSTGSNTNGTTRSSSRVATPRTSTYRSSSSGNTSRSSGKYSTGGSTRSSSSGNYNSGSRSSSSRSSGAVRSSSSNNSRSSGAVRSSGGSSSRSSGSSSSSRSGGRRN